MYNFAAFDSKRLKIMCWLSRYVLLVALTSTVLAYTLFRASLVFYACLLVVTYGSLFLWLAGQAFVAGNVFSVKNKLPNFFSTHGNHWPFVNAQYDAMRRSVFFKRNTSYKNGRYVFALAMPNEPEMAISFDNKGGCVAWLKLDKKFPHLVVDSLNDRHSLRWQVAMSSLPPQELKLEADFPSHFKVYQEVDQQITTMQILSPDRMDYLINNVNSFNLEINDNCLRLYAPHAQNSSSNFQSYLQTLETLYNGLKVARVNNIRY